MPSLRPIIIFLCSLLLVESRPAWPIKASQISDHSGDDFVANVVVVGLKNPPQAGSALHRLGGSSLDKLLQHYKIRKMEKLVTTSPAGLFKGEPAGRIDQIYFAHFEGSASPLAVAEALAKDPQVEFAEPKYIRYLYAIPNDSLYSWQYYLPLIQAPAAWDLAKGEQKEVIIAVVDGGTDISHPDLAANLWQNPGEIPGNSIDDDQNGYIDDVHGARMYDHSGDPTRPFYLTIYGAHGTHTSGLAAAVSHNALGIAGSSWNARFIAVHAGSSTREEHISNGFEGILYAVENGARIISCSWGGNSRSEYESRVMEYVNSLGAVVVAAYGNDYIYSESEYPAAYAGVLGVAATNSSDRKASFSTFGYSVDVCAPGEEILSTYPNSAYAMLSGTSMSTPLVAGVIALVMTKNPQWTARQAAEQVRASCDDIDELNPGYAGRLGRGRINAYRALTETWPAIRLEQVAIIDADSLIKPDEKIKISITLKNYLAAANGISLSLTDNSSFVTITDGSASLASLGSLQQVDLNGVFEFQVAANAPSGHAVTFNLDMVADGYHDSGFFVLTVLPSFGNLSINHITTSVSNVGRIGFGDPNNGKDGIGFKYLNGPNLLFEGAIICGTGPDRISNASRGILSGSGQSTDADFSVAPDGDVAIQIPGSRSDEESRTAFEDKKAADPLNILITQQTYAFSREPYEDIIIFQYTIKNQSLLDLDHFHFGLYFDWDMDGGSFATNVATYDADRQMGYVYDTGNGPDTFIGVRLLAPAAISYRAIYNDQADPNNPSWGLHDGFTDEEKWQAISDGLSQINAGPADISNVIAAGPMQIPANGSAEVVFAMVAAPSRDELLTNADHAADMWRLLFTVPVEETPTPPAMFALEQNHPNPFNPQTTIGFNIPRAQQVSLSIFDLMGREIKILVSGFLAAGPHQATWDGRDEENRAAASGTYFYVLQDGEQKLIRRMILLR